MNMLKNLMAMQSKLKKVKELAAQSEFSEELEGISVRIKGDHTILRIDVKGQYSSQEEMSDLITVALNRAHQKAEQFLKEATKEALGPMGKLMPL